MSACQTPRSWGSCIEGLAAGWINPPDLCPPCTRAFMAALDWVAEPGMLKWHQDFRERASTREGVSGGA